MGNIADRLENWTNGKYCGYACGIFTKEIGFERVLFYKKIGFERVLVDKSIFRGSQGHLEALVHIMASPLLIPSALLGSFIPTPAVRQVWVTWTVPGTSKGKVMPCTQNFLLPMNLI